MTFFWLASIMTLIPLAWTVMRGMKQRRMTDVWLMVLIYFCCMFHLYILGAMMYGSQEPAMWVRILHCFSVCQLVPMVYVCLCRRVGVVRRHELVALVSLTGLALVSRGNLGFGWGDCNTTDELRMFEVNVFYNGEKVWMVYNYEFIMIFQGLFLLYKVLLFLDVMKFHNYHFTPKARMLLKFLSVCIVLVLASMVPSTEFWAEGHNLQIFTFCGMLMLSGLFVMFAEGYDISPLVNANEEPVMLSGNRQFADMAQKLRMLVDNDELPLSSTVHMEDVAHLLGTNRTYVAQMMKEEFGTTFSNYMNTLRVEKAKRIMADGTAEEKIQEVAWRSGFSSLSSFNKVFKTCTGLTPSEWQTAHCSA